jgi:hypothetical protein
LSSSGGRESWRYQTRDSLAGGRGPSPSGARDSDLGLSAWAALAELRAGPLSPRLAYSPTTLPLATERPGRESYSRRAVESSAASEAGDSSFGPLLSSTLRDKRPYARDSIATSSVSSLADASVGGPTGIDIGGRNPPLSREDGNLRQVVASPGSIIDYGGHLASSTPNDGSGHVSHSQSIDFSRESFPRSLIQSSDDEGLAESRPAPLTQSPTATECPLDNGEELRRSPLPDAPTSDDRPRTYSQASPLAPSEALLESSVQSLPAQGPSSEEPRPRWRRPLLGFTRPQVDVLKCSLAYTLASLFTFVPVLNSLLLGTSSAHTIATVSVYYNPAKSLGTMLEADVYCLVVATIAAVVSLAAVGTLKAADSVGTSWGRDCGDWTALLFWFGGSLSVLAWLKVRLGKQSFNSATSMGLVIMSNVIIKGWCAPPPPPLVVHGSPR